ncbi:DUF4174 domain-containing protein [Pseudaestuariivita rosea]|uniref:DUF4174 domain-containing protein n=1 Tax=Pseudaestuariivita rosea TaxID=2763263 RepID=UPI003AF6FF6B
MKRILSLICMAGLAMPTFGDTMVETALVLPPVEQWQSEPTLQLDAVEINLDDFKWIARPVVVFADSPNDPRLQEQVDLLAARADELAVRDVVVLVDSNPAANSAIRQKLRPRGFMLVLIGKDGGVKLRKPSPWDVREISRTIDKMPLRRQEIRDRNRSE